jgi:hypothetical protein
LPYPTSHPTKHASGTLKNILHPLSRMVESSWDFHRTMENSVKWQWTTYLGTNKTTERLLSRAHGLVVATGGSVGVVLGDTRCGSSEARDLCGGMRGVVLGLGLVLLALALDLVASAAGQAAEGVLNGASGRVDVRLEGGCVIVGRHDDGLRECVCV